MTKTKITLISFAVLLLAPLLVSAQSVTVNVNASAGVNVSTRKLTTIITRSDTQINNRISDLNKLSARVQAMKNVSATAKANVSAQVQTNISGLTTLKAKIDADTSADVAANDEKAIFGPFRIYALVVPQGYLLSSVDRINTIAGLMNDLTVKLQVRIAAAKTAGKDTSSLETLVTYINAKTADSKTQADLAQSLIVNLKPDGGDKTIGDANHSALVSARADIKTATNDLKAARENIAEIISGLKSFNSATSSHTTVSASSTTN